MARRSIDWSKGLSDDLRDKVFAQKFIMNCLDEGLPLQLVLRRVIRAYGIKEFSQKIKMPAPNVLRAVNPKHNPTISTVNRLLNPFSLKINVTPLTSNRRAA